MREKVQEQRDSNQAIKAKAKNFSSLDQKEKIVVRENTRRAEIDDRTTEKKRKIEKETEARGRYNSQKEKRKEVLVETMNFSSHEKSEYANENTMDAQNEELADKSNRRQLFEYAFTISTNAELS